MTRKPWICRTGLHAWRIPQAFFRAQHLHEECSRCGWRRVTFIPGARRDYPYDRRWLEGGESSKPLEPRL